VLIEAARRSGADAVHPGYGFLSENADFARAVLDAGLTWVGPTPESIEAMGSKIEAKRIMRDAGVPVLEAPDVPTEADLPLLVKASAGGGGRGMRVVRRLEDMASEVAAAQAEAESAFGDGTVFVESYVEHGRHVEVQVVGTTDGVLVLGERDCSIQRRHQKVVEESPAPGLPDEVRTALHDAGRRAAEAIDYRGAGTVEFLVDAADTTRFWFLEMNTRLQVEHPVTEAVFGVDLVEMQLAVAEGLVTGAARPPRPAGDGHAIEVRLYAEDPAAGYGPQSGVLTRFEIPAGEGIRVDAGYESGSAVSTFYDAMLAKVVCHAPTREAAARKLADALARARIHGVTTNRDQLVEVLRSEVFVRGEVDTQLLAERAFVHVRGDVCAPVAAAIALAERAGAGRTVQRGIPVGWRNVAGQPQRTEFDDGTVVEWWRSRDGYRVGGVAVVGASPTRVSLETDGVRTTYDVTIAGEHVDVDGPTGHRRLTRKPRFSDPAEAVASGSLLAPMPGTVVSVAVEKGDEVTAAQPVLVLEAMKMQHTVAAPYDGVVTAVDVQPGQQVAAGDVLAVVEENA
jgi:propionyl-CoA carboxylase alpha chain